MLAKSIALTAIILLQLFISGCDLNATDQSEGSMTKAIDPSRYTNDILRFEFNDKAFPPKPGGIVWVGSSSFRLWNHRIREDLAPLNMVPRAFGGSTMPDVLHFMDRIVMPYKPRAVVLYEGDNDIGSYHHSPQQVLDNVNRFTERLWQTNPETRLYIVSIKPSISRESVWPQQQAANRLLQARCAQDKRLTYIDTATPMFDRQGKLKVDLFMDDKLHMNSKGYALWASIIKPVVMAQERGFE